METKKVMRKSAVFVVMLFFMTSTNLSAVNSNVQMHQTLTIDDELEIKPMDWNPGDDYKMHFPQLPDPLGWDVDASYVDTVFPYNRLADDWMCTESGPVTDIHFWGSWLEDKIGSIVSFSIKIFSDIPADPPTIPYSHPGIILWERTFLPDDWMVAGPWEGIQGWYDPGEGFFLDDNHYYYWQYNIENIDDPFIQEEGTIYWLSISAIILPTTSPQPRWGWKTSLDHWNDDAVHGYWFESEWTELYEPPAFTSSIDLAFVIDGINESENLPPYTPSQPNGPTTVTENVKYTYTTGTSDPNGDQVKYGFDFDNDGIISPSHWTNLINSGTTCSVKITFYGTGTRYLRVKAEDEHGTQSGFSPALVVVVSGANNPPTTPQTPIGPSSGMINAQLTFSTNATDPDDDTIRYGWDWNGDGIVDEWSNLQNSGQTDTRSHAWNCAGTYHVQVVAEDSRGGQSDFSTAKTVEILLNTPPSKPTITGPPSGRVGKSYTYYATTTDAEGDQLYYLFDWSDGTNSSWIGPYDSGQIASVSHSWSNQGSYSVKVKVKDEHDLESVWSDSLEVSMPKNKQFQPGFLQYLEQHYPILFQFFSLLTPV